MRGGGKRAVASRRAPGQAPSAPLAGLHITAICPSTRELSGTSAAQLARAPPAAQAGEQPASASGSHVTAQPRGAADAPLGLDTALEPSYAPSPAADMRAQRRTNRSSAAPSPPRIAFLYASPLMNQLRGAPIDLLDFKAERDTLIGAIRRSGVRVDISCDTATTRTLSNLLLDGCRVLHYSGHGFATAGPTGAQSVLAFEDDLGGTHALGGDALQQLVAAGARRDGSVASLELAFISACHSVAGGEAFVKAGVPHVVAVRREARVQDRAACAFAEAFYYAMLRNRTVREAFDVGVQAVANGAGIVAASDESRKFLLLPADGAHDVALFADADGGPPCELLRAVCAHNLPAFFPLQFVGRHAVWQQAVAGVRQKRAVLLFGPPGVGKTALAIATAHYLLERHAFCGGVYMVSLNGIDSIASLFRAICRALHEAGDGNASTADARRLAAPPVDGEAFLALLTPLLREREQEGSVCLLLDQCDGLRLPASTLASLVARVLTRVESLSVMLTSSEPLTLSGVAQRQMTIAPLAPLDCARLFVMLAPRALTHAEIGSDRLDRLAHEMNELVVALRECMPEIDQFVMQMPADGGAANPALRIVRWKFADSRSADIFAAHVQQTADALAAESAGADGGRLAGAAAAPLGGAATQPQASALSFEVRGASVIARLSHLRLLARHRVLRALCGSPRAISLAVHGLVADDGVARPLDELGTLLELAGISTAASAGVHAAPPWPGLLSERTQQMVEEVRSALFLSPLDELSPGTSSNALCSVGGGSSGSLLGLTPTPAPAPNGGGTEGAVRRGSGELPPNLEIDASEVELEEWLGGGTFGAVYRGTYRGTRVAVKQFFARLGSHKAFAREAALLSKLRHPNVVQLEKVCRHGSKGLLILTEFLQTSLFCYLHEPTTPTSLDDRRRSGSAELSLLPCSEVLRLTHDIAAGMHYLHSFAPTPVLHRNLKSQNLLLDASGTVKVADFGWSRFKDASSGSGSSSTFFHGWQWVAPEILSSKPYTEKADVYSFAMIMWETLTRRVPFKGMNPVQIGLAVREQKLRPNVPSSCLPAHARLMERCWHDEADSRPSFVEIVELLSEIRAADASGSGARDMETNDRAGLASSAPVCAP